MALDYLAFHKIIELIKQSIEGGKISKISQISNEEFLFIIRNDNKNHSLLISTHPNMSYINIVETKPESNQTPSNLLMLFRKYLENGKIVSFNQQNEDRIVLMEIVNRDDYFNETVKKLYIELIGRASNLILTDHDNKIMDSLKKIPLEYSNLRTIQPGIHYVLPEKPSSTQIPYDLENEMKHTGKNYDDIKNEIENSEFIYITTSEGKSDFHFIPFSFMNGSSQKYNWNAGLDEFYKSSLQNERHRQYTSELEKLCKSEIKKSEKKIKKLQEELGIAKEGIVYKEYGDLLLTYLQGKIIKEDSVIIYDEIKECERKIPYNPLFDVYRNANMFYKKYQKSKVAVSKIQEQIELCQENFDYFQTVKFHLDGADLMTSNQIKEELISQGYFRKYQKPIKANKKNKKPVVKIYKPLGFKVNGIPIYAGQNNLQNEYLSFKMAAKTDMFFHVQQGPGSHVVVKSTTLDENIIRTAANIAACYSQAKFSSTVAVNYTMIKNIKKIPGGKPGKVIITQQKTIYIDPDFDALNKLIQID